MITVNVCENIATFTTKSLEVVKVLTREAVVAEALLVVIIEGVVGPKVAKVHLATTVVANVERTSPTRATRWRLTTSASLLRCQCPPRTTRIF